MRGDELRRRRAVFVVMTHFQALVAEAMVRGMPEFRDRPVTVLANGQELTRNRAYPDHVQVRVIDRVPLRFFDGGARRAKEALAPIVSDLGAGGMEFLVANVDHPLGNRALYLSRQGGQGGIRLSVYPEGIANIVPTRPPLRKKAANLAKILLGPILGTPFFPYGEDLGGERLADRRFTLLPASLFPEAAGAIPVPLGEVVKSRGPWNGRGTMILGQPLDHVGPRAAAERLQRRLLSVSEGYPSPHWYKPHPREGPWAVELARRGDWQLITDDRPAEEVIMDMTPSTLLSFFSSALVHTKLLLGDRVECVAVAPGEAMVVAGDSEERWRELREVYARLCIRVHGE